MKSILTIMIFSCLSCSTQHLSEKEWFKGGEKHYARITYYSVGQDKWGDLTACPETPRAKEGITVAAHPEFDFGTEVYIPGLKDKIGDGKFIVQDRGSAVTKKKASKGKHYVFDVFVKNKSLLRKHAYNRPMYMEVYVLNE